jgi:hypothetical protein
VELHDPQLYQEYLRRFPEGIFVSVSKTLDAKNQPQVPSDLDKARLADLTRLAEQGNRQAMTQLGKAYEAGVKGAPQDLRKPSPITRKPPTEETAKRPTVWGTFTTTAGKAFRSICEMLLHGIKRELVWVTRPQWRVLASGTSSARAPCQGWA